MLLGVHLLIAIHVAHWLSTGTTLSPLEPSESMEFSKRGVVNAGLVFFALTIGSTLVLGRWFCGWACHLVALQDASRWLLLKLGIRPRPLRSRLLLFAPLLAALYMFAWPWIDRALQGSIGVTEVHLQTSGFWDTFPTWPIALLTFVVCGFLCVLFLGSKGFCTYACPYGALFTYADKLAPFRIRVNDACNACGRCTATCTSNVLVHAEVRDYGAVVDPGCMKCMDCVSVCPTNALSFGLGKPALFTAPRVEAPQPTNPAFTGRQELALGIVFAVSLLSFRGLYQLIPFLLALGLAGVLTALWLVAWRTVRRPSQKLLRWHLKKGGSWTGAGKAFACVMIVLGALTLHAASVQVVDAIAARAHDATGAFQPGPQPWTAQLVQPAQLTPEQRAQVDAALGWAERLDAISLLPSAANAMRQAWLHLLRGDDPQAERFVKQAIALWPKNGQLRLDHARFLIARGRAKEAIPAFREAILLEPDHASSARHGLGRALVETGQLDEAEPVYAALLAKEPPQAQLWAEGAALAALRQDYALSAARFRAGLARARGAPEASALRSSLLEVLLRADETDELVTLCEEILRTSPADAQAHRLLGLAHQLRGELKLAERHLRRALQAERHPDALEGLARILAQRGEAAEAAKLRAEAQGRR